MTTRAFVAVSNPRGHPPSTRLSTLGAAWANNTGCTDCPPRAAATTVAAKPRQTFLFIDILMQADRWPRQPSTSRTVIGGPDEPAARDSPPAAALLQSEA